LDTDIKGARAANMPSLQVLTGVDGILDAYAAPPAHRPCFLGRDLGALAVPHPAPTKQDDRWYVRDAVAWVDAGELRVEGAFGPDGLDGARAACAAGWEAADTGHLPTLGGTDQNPVPWAHE